MMGWRHKRVKWAALLLLLVLLPSPISPIFAQSQIEGDDFSVDYPHSATFSLTLTDQADVVDAALVFEMEKSTCVSAQTRVPLEVSGRSLEWTWIMNRSGNPPPGATLKWHWELTDGAGGVFNSEERRFDFRDERFTWQSVGASGLTLYWYSDPEVGPALLEAASDGLRRLEGEMGIRLQDDVQIFIYDDFDAMRAALLYVSDWAGGVAFAEYNIILLGVPAGSVADWGVEVVQHELAHLVIGQFSRSCVGGSPPTWLNEGLAVFAEGEPDGEILSDLERATDEDLFVPVRSLGGAFPAHSSGASLAYSQSYSLVDFLLSTYGAEKMQSLLLLIADGVAIDAALEQVYGFNQDGLETAWRAAVGAPPRTIPPTPTALLARAIATAVPLDTSQGVPTPPLVVATPLPQETEPDARGLPFCAPGLAPLGALAILFVARRRGRRRRP